MTKLIWILAAATLACIFLSTGCEEETTDSCDPNDFANYCEDETTICYCNSQTRTEECGSCDEDCAEWGGKCEKNTQNLTYGCKCNTREENP